PASTVFFEVLGLDEAAFKERQQAVREHLESGAESPTGCVRGLSPHAPYTLHPELFHWTVEMALAHEAPVAMHLAETREELELLRNGSGPLVEMLRDLGVWRHGVLRPMDGVLSFLETMSPLQRVLVVHGNYLSDKEIEFLE